MGRSVLAHADRVVREHVDHRDLHDRREPDRAARVVAEDEEPRPERAELRERHPVQDRRHRVLADPQMQVPARTVLGLEVAGALEGQPRLRRGRQVRRTPDQPRHASGDRVEHRAGRVAPGQPLLVGAERGDVVAPTVGELAPLHPRELVRELRMRLLVGGQPLEPCPAELATACADPVLEHGVDAVGDQEGRVLGPAVVPLGGPDLLLTEGFAVRAARVLLRRRAVRDVRVDDDQRGASDLAAERLERPREHLEVVRVGDPRDVPAVAGEPRGHVLAEREGGVPLDRDVVVVVHPAQVRQLEMARERGRLVRDPLHHAAVPRHRVHVEIEQLEVRPVVAGGQPSRRDRHPHRGRHPLAERPGRRLDPRGPPVLRMAGTPGVELAEPAQVVELHRELAERLVRGVHGLHPREVEHRVQERRRVTHRQDEAVAVRPDRVVGVEPEESLPQRVRDWRHRHRGPRMPRVRLLDGVDAQGADRGDRELVGIGDGDAGHPWLLFDGAPGRAIVRRERSTCRARGLARGGTTP